MASEDDWACYIGQQMDGIALEAQLEYVRLLEMAKEEHIDKAIEALKAGLGRFPSEREVMAFLFKDEMYYDQWDAKVYGDD